MRRILIILPAIGLPFLLSAQVIFKTIVPRQPIAVGESFPVQFVLEDTGKEDGIIPPVFKDFRLVSGPYTYNGAVYGVDGSKSLKNIVYTLVAIKPGRFIVGGATAKINGRFVKSDDAVVEVVDRIGSTDISAKQNKEDNLSEYFLRVGEDPYEKMRKNLFLKVMVDKKNCYVGEPVVATFKLYSRLESRSDIVKNPGFYGFAVQDIISLNDNMTVIENVDGKPFDVHIVRVVQLYPLQPGVFTIDPMEVKNKVEFSKSAISKRTEQAIVEGIVDDNPRIDDGNTITYETNINTEKIAIHVRPYPVKNKPPGFNGATGMFFIHAELEKNELVKNEEGTLIVSILGKGNFPQMASPIVNWPAGIEGFDPVVKDSLDKSQSPLLGSRTFRYSFVANRAGDFSIPAIALSFFDPDSNNYKTIATSPLDIKIDSGEIQDPVAGHGAATPARNTRYQWALWAGIGLVLIIFVLGFVFIRRKKQQAGKSNAVADNEPEPVTIEKLLRPAYFALKADDNRFYGLLQKSIWDFFTRQLNLEGSKMNKPALYSAMKAKKLDEQACQAVIAILGECETAMFTRADLNIDKEQLLEKTKVTLERIETSLQTAYSEYL